MFSQQRLLTTWILLAHVGVASGCGDSHKEIASFRHVCTVSCLSFSPDGKYLVAGSHGGSAQNADFWKGEVGVWDVAARKKVGLARLPLRVNDLAFSPKGDRLAVGCGNLNNHRPNYLGFTEQPGEVELFDFPALKEKARAQQGSVVYAVRYSPDGKTLACASFVSVLAAGKQLPGTVLLRNAETLRPILELQGLVGWGPKVAFSPDGKAIAVADYQNQKQRAQGLFIKFFDPRTGELRREMPIRKGDPAFVAFLPDGKSLVVQTSSGEIGLWDENNGQDVTPPGMAEAFAWNRHAALSPDGKLLGVTTQKTGRPRSESWVVLWDLGAKKVRARWRWGEERGGYGPLAFSPDGTLLAVGAGVEIKLFEVPK